MVTLQTITFLKTQHKSQKDNNRYKEYPEAKTKISK